MRRLLFFLIILGSLLTFAIWSTAINNSNVKPHQWYHLQKPDESQTFRYQLSSMCHGLDKAIISQANTPLGSKVTYDGEKKRTIQVTPGIFNTFAKMNPFSNKTRHTCAVVGNGGILANSNCGKMIDSADFIIRCNLPPLSKEYKKHVGTKTDLVTANPTILFQKYNALNKDQYKFVENLKVYGNSLLLLPAFSFGFGTSVSLRAYHVLKDFKSPIQTVFLNPEYLTDLASFWRSHGLKSARLSSGLMMVSLAMELCADVHLYGFWPLSFPPRDGHFLTNHYYDDKPPVRSFHSMPAEFLLILQLQSQGMLTLHLDCER